ncbi:hypothetical protein [Teredinibacter turnerae]|nr:hypothetical protein [Teredinibacter turnerae]
MDPTLTKKAHPMGEPLSILAFDLVYRATKQGLIRLRLTPAGRPAVVQIG